MPITIKVIFNGDIRRLVLDEKSPYPNLVDSLPETFSDLPKSFHLKFRDDEDDLVTITSTTELQEALELQTKGTLKLIVVGTSDAEEIGGEPELISDSDSISSDDFFVVDSKAKTPLLEPKAPNGAESNPKQDPEPKPEPKPIEPEPKPVKVSEPVNPVPAKPEVEEKAEPKKVDIQVIGKSVLIGEAKVAPKPVAVKVISEEEKPLLEARKAKVLKVLKPEELKPKEAKTPVLTLSSLAKNIMSEAKKMATPVVAKWKANKTAPVTSKCSSLFIRDVNIPDNTKVSPGAEFVKTWLIENNGKIDWPKSTKLLCIGGNMVKNGKTFNLSRVAVGSKYAISVPITAPTQPGRYRSTFRLKDTAEFGNSFWVQIKVNKPVLKPLKAKPLPKVSESKLNVGAHFVKDTTIPDDQVFTPGFETVKTWGIKNTGKDAWPKGTRLVYVGGNWDMKDVKIETPFGKQALPGANVEVSVKVTTPKAPGKYSARFQLQLPGGRNFGHKFWVNIKVASFTDISDLSKQFLTDKKVVAVLQEELPTILTALANGKSMVKIVKRILAKHPDVAAHPFVTVILPMLPDAEKFLGFQLKAVVAMQAMMAKAPKKPVAEAKAAPKPAPKKAAAPKKSFEAKGKPSPTTTAPKAPKRKPVKHAKALATLVEMGFNDVELMKKLLNRFNGNLNKVLNHLHTN